VRCRRCRGEAEHVTRSMAPKVQVWKSTVQSPRPDSRRDHRLVCVVTELVSLIRPEALDYCYEFARRLLFTGQSTTVDFSSFAASKAGGAARAGSVP
jgi:hypothetical protein